MKSILMRITGKNIIYTPTPFKYSEEDKNLDTTISERPTMYSRRKDTLGDCSFWEKKIVSIPITSKPYIILGTF